MPAPIAIFAFNRPEHLLRTLDALATNNLTAESDLTIFRDGPSTLREKIMKDAETTVTRKATPLHRVSDNVLEMHYNVRLTEKTTGLETSLNECHSMRYWFLPELRYLAGEAGFRVLCESGWMHENVPRLTDWNAWILAEL